jgi:CheY-like chemotaxis protein
MKENRILLIEDNPDKQKMFIDALQGKATIACAATEEQAREIFDKTQNITLIAVDACLVRDEPDTLGLVAYLRSKYTGPIIAISSNKDYNQKLMKAGCSHQEKKDNAPSLIATLLEEDLQYPTVPYDDKKQAENMLLENILELLHNALVPSGIDESFKCLDKIESFAELSKNEKLIQALPDVRKDLGNLQKLGDDPFDKKYTDQLVLIRDALLQFAI